MNNKIKMQNKTKTTAETSLNYLKSKLRSNLKQTRKFFQQTNSKLLTPQYYLENYLPKLLPLLKQDEIISIYMPINYELDTIPLIDYFLQNSFSISLPIVVQKS